MTVEVGHIRQPRRFEDMKKTNMHERWTEKYMVSANQSRKRDDNTFYREAAEISCKGQAMVRENSLTASTNSNENLT